MNELQENNVDFIYYGTHEEFTNYGCHWLLAPKGLTQITLFNFHDIAFAPIFQLRKLRHEEAK